MIPLDLDDWPVFDRTQTVTYTVYGPSGAGDTIEDVSALRMAVDGQSLLGEVSGHLKRSNWHIRRSTLPGVVPAIGDRITDASGDVWVVVDMPSKQTDDTRWRMVCQYLGGAG